ncbi:AAA domain-containing protein [Oryzisolibacter propanilivorax]|uniref:AAA domain-containing protein n=1 Tax=Oryzisolibacter propanilivorax TaxID=1527607 RepID=A0A1G9TLA4_9BURK|nr:bifunctional DNA primase/polymerase [Oryzisolibacter propanilivorax]SDM48348.1 AAA domain-containing protein [Oryzisolibacter propanilivorax]
MSAADALQHAAAGYPVFPLVAGGKRPATAHGLKDASTDPDTIRAWWHQQPSANIGMALPADVLAVDIDVKDVDGFATLAALTAEHGKLPETRTVQTASGGWHLLFRKPADVRVKNRAGLRPGVDVRATGGYLVAPGSTINGTPYRLLNDCEPAECPRWLLDVLTEEKPAPASPVAAAPALQKHQHDPYTQRAIERAASDVVAAGEGERNHKLNAAAYGLARLAGAGRLDWHHTAAVLERAALAAGLAPAEVRQTLKSAHATGLASPSYEGLPKASAPRLPVAFEPQHFDTAGAEEAEHPLARIVQPCTALQAPEWLLPGFLAAGLTLIAGGHGVGKTTALLPLAAGVAGIHEPGWPLAPKHWRSVVYICEDTAQAQRILHGLAGHLQTTTAAIAERLHLVDARRLPAAVLVQVGGTYRERYSRSVQGVELLPLVVLDTQAATIALKSENDNSEASAAVAMLKQHFAGLPVWLVAHLAKQNLNRSDVQHLTSRGASAWEADANATAFLVKEGEGMNASRWLTLGKRRFEPRWPELQLQSHCTDTMGYDRFGEPEPLALRWAIAQPQEGSRQELAAKAREAQALQDEAELRQEVRDVVQIAWQEGHPLNRAGVKAKVRRKASEVVACIERLLSEGWLQEIHVPRDVRTHPRKDSFLVNLDTSERDAVRRGEPLPQDKAAIPESWKRPISSVPEETQDATETVAIPDEP